MKNKLIKQIVAASAFLLATGAMNAQKAENIKENDAVVKVVERNPNPPLRVFELGVRYMPTFSAIDLRTAGGDVVSGSAQVSHGAGLMLALNFSKNIGIQAEADYYQITQSYRDVNLNRDVKINYINVPLLLSINTNKTKPVNFNVVVGPQLGINFGTNLKTTGEGTSTLQAVIGLKQSDIGAAYGAGFEFALNPDHTVRLDVGYRGFYGFVDVNSTNLGNNTYNVIVQAKRKTNAAYIGFTFLF